MKRFFEKASKPFGSPSTSRSSTVHSTDGSNQAGRLSSPTTPHTTGLQPAYVVPAVPHPCPHAHLALLVTKEGLLIRPHFPGQNLKSTGSSSVSYVRVSWGKSIKIEEVENRPDEQLDWSGSTIVYGIVGVLELFACSYLLVITSRSEVGHVLDPSHMVYGVKHVIDIPLTEERARTALETLAARNAALTRPSLIPRRNPGLSIDLDNPTPVKGAPRVQFSTNLDTVIPPSETRLGSTADVGSLIPRPASAQSSSSDTSIPSSEASVATSPVFKTLADRLSFWSRLSKRTTSLNDPQMVLPVEPMSLAEEQEALDKLMHEEQPADAIESILASTAPAPVTAEERHSELEVKVVRECIREFTKGGMYFAYTFDITRSLQHKQEVLVKSQKQHDLLAGLGALPVRENNRPITPTPVDAKVSPLTEPYPALPLWRRVDKHFWWNEWMSKPFIDAGLHSFILPIMQGYCQVTKFNIPPDPIVGDDDSEVDYILISRRSRYRPGLRYQRRGIDDEAHVANFVETETILRVEREAKENVFSYVQIRGSIPLFWTQAGYGLKPPPILAPDRTYQQNLDTLKRHFQNTIPVYGPHTIVNLAEQHGKEGPITQSYKEFMHELNMKDAQYHEYDFHVETKGMKYENISNLIERMERTFESQGYFWVSNDILFSRQKGIFRVNCIDCLDRTNVVQSAFARYVMNKQLGAVALLNPSNAGRTDADLAFNDVWANNGDAISRAYAGTSALKGDFTRTGKRDLSGMLNDGVNSLARMYTSTFSDWFCQAVIDFMLGNRTTSVFSEFLLKLKSTDPRDLIRLSRIRAEAIATSVSRVLAEGERLLSGWTLFAPEDLNTRIGIKFEEKVLLLSAKALYIVSYDYTLEKVKIYTRVPLGDIISISKGAYILSPLEESSRDSEQNAGFIVTWLSSNQESRVTSYSVRNNLDLATSSPSPPSAASPTFGFGNRRRSRSNTLPALSNILTGASFSTAGSGQQNFAAFKVLPIDPARIRRETSAVSDQYVETSEEMHGAASCREAVSLIVERIARACDDVGGGHGDFVKDEDVVSLEDAQRMTSVYAKMEYGVKRLLWLGG
ncbi:SacI homology domain-containing protein [Crassisporium funariophilum]|nr:SacI homology domain-containing protein [Crassisporium funariophilum]